MVEDWIDELCAVWAIEDNAFKTVRSVNLVKETNFPESIDLVELADHPVALTFWPSLNPQYSQGGPKRAFWSGETEFHLAPDFAKARIPQMLPWYKKIWVAAAAHVKLNNKVEYFIIPEQDDAIVLTSLKYGEEAIHWGMVVKWIVKERVDNQITVTL